MRRLSNRTVSILLSFLIVSVFSIAFFQAGQASAQPCGVEICKSAPGAGDQEFLIDSFDSGQTDTETLLDGECFETLLNFDADVEFTEQQIPGWVLDDIECDDVPGFDTSFIENGVVVLCTTQQGPIGMRCFFNNVRGTAGAVPTLTEWGMIAAGAGLGLIGVFFAYKRRKAQAV